MLGGKALIIGTGNLAHHFAPAFKRLNLFEHLHLLGRNKETGMRISSTYNIPYLANLHEISAGTNIVFLMVNDSAIKPLTKKLKKILLPDTIIIHFSGATDLKEIDPYFKRKGNLWPIQSFTAIDEIIDLSEIPICVNTNSEQLTLQIVALAKLITSEVIQVSEHQKQILHLTAVIVNNFSNHLYDLSHDLLAENQLNFNLLRPLIAQTIEKIRQAPPSDMQTGPAIRGDAETIQQHMDLLTSKPELQQIYQILSSSIIRTSK